MLSIFVNDKPLCQTLRLWEQWVNIVVQLGRTIAYDFATTNDDSSQKVNSKIITQAHLMLAQEKCVMLLVLLLMLPLLLLESKIT